MTRRWLGGVFGNTVGSDTSVANTTGVFSMEQQYYMKQEGGWQAPLGTQLNPATNVAALVADGKTANGYYWIKGSGSVANAREFYCILDPSFALGAGWMVAANHDAGKPPNSAHQARLTSWSAYVGYDNASGNGNVNSDPTAAVMIPDRSYSCDMTDISINKFAHVVYASASLGTWNVSNLLNPQGYYGGTWTNAQTIPNSAAWTLEFDNYGVTFNSYARRVWYNSGATNYNVQGIGCWNDSGGPSPTINGSGATVTNYPVFCGVWTWTSSSGTATMSFTDSGSNGFDDFQDGSGMSDLWGVENQGANAFRGNPSCLLVG